MDMTQVALVVTTITAGGFAGIIAAMVGVIQRMLNGLGYREYTLAMQGIIVSGRRSMIVRALLLTPILAAVITLITLWGGVRQGPFVLTLLGLLAFIAGPLLVSRFFNEPWYDRVMAWSPDQSPASDWQHERMHWFRLNLARLLIGGAGCHVLYTGAGNPLSASGRAFYKAQFGRKRDHVVLPTSGLTSSASYFQLHFV